MKKNKGFTLTEILAVIAVLGIILIIAIPSVKKQIEKSKKNAFFTSVASIVNKISTSNVIEQNDYCMYSYSEDKKNQNELIERLDVLVHKEDDKLVYSVLAKAKGEKYEIDSYDFSKLDASKDNEWKEEYAEGKSYSYFAVMLSGLLDTGEYSAFQNLTNYKICE